MPGVRRPPTVSRSIRRARWILLAVIVLVIGGVSALFVLGRTVRPEPEVLELREGESEGAGSAEADRKTVVSEGFDYEQQVAGEPVFRLRGERFTTDRNDVVALEGVDLTVYRDGEPFRVRSATATYSPDRQQAELEGDVVLTDQRGWVVESERLDLLEGGQSVVSRGGRVRFRRAEALEGTAGEVRYDSDAEQLVLIGDVTVRERATEGSGAPGRLRAERVVWQRRRRRLHATGGARLDRGGQWLESNEINAALTADESAFESMTAKGDARGAFEREDGTAVEFEAVAAGVSFDRATGDARHARFEALSPAPPVHATLRSPAAPERSIEAPIVDLRFGDGGQLEVLEAERSVILREEQATGVPRFLRARHLTARFGPGGELADARLDRAVLIQDGATTARGDRGTVLDGGARIRLTGEPAVAQDARGKLSAPTLIYDRGAGRVDAEGGARGRFEPDEGEEATGSDAALPVEVQAESGFFLLDGDGFEFAGQVQVVRGDTLLFADRLHGDEPGGSMVAEGSVRSIWTDRASGRAVPTTVTAETMTYDRDAERVRYEGSTTVRQGSRQISGDQVEVELDEQRRARRMTVTGSVVVEDRTSGQTVHGDLAVYELEARSAVVTGEPVEIQERSGAVLRGSRALFDLETGVARLVSEAP